MANGRRNLKFFIGYAIWREYRYNSHRSQNEKARQLRLHPKPPTRATYGTYIGSGLLVAPFIALWDYLFWQVTFMLVWGIMFDVVIAFVVIAGCCEVYKARHG